MEGVSETREECVVVDVEKATLFFCKKKATLYSPLAESEAMLWAAHCIYRVPARIRNLNPAAYKPKTVSLGPYHHDEPDLKPMEVHKQRAVKHVVQRAGKSEKDLMAALWAVVEQLKGAYADLGDGWRGPGKLEQFLQMMVADGCFLLEVMRTAAEEHLDDYAPNDPIFSEHGQLHTVPYIGDDMLLIENQLPLLVLERIVAVERGNSSENCGPNDDLVNKMVLQFKSWPGHSMAVTDDMGLGLHPLDIYRRSMLSDKPYQATRSFKPVPASLQVHDEDDESSDDDDDPTRSAVELYKAGIRFKQSLGDKGTTKRTSQLQSITFTPGWCFQRGVLRMPWLVVDDSTEQIFFNVMAFERLHVTATNGVIAYVLFMEAIVKSAEDVKRLRKRKERVIDNAVGPDEKVASMFNNLTNGVMGDRGSQLNRVHKEMHDYLRSNFRKKINKWWGHLRRKYFRNPWTAISLAAAVVLLGLAVVQTVYAILAYVHRKDK